MGLKMTPPPGKAMKFRYAVRGRVKSYFLSRVNFCPDLPFFRIQCLSGVNIFQDSTFVMNSLLSGIGFLSEVNFCPESNFVRNQFMYEVNFFRRQLFYESTFVRSPILSGVNMCQVQLFSGIDSSQESTFVRNQLFSGIFFLRIIFCQG